MTFSSSCNKHLLSPFSLPRRWPRWPPRCAFGWSPICFPGSAVLQRHRRMGRPETKAARVSPCCGRPETKAARVSPRCLAMRRDLLTWAHTSPWGRLLSQTGGMEQRRGKSGPLGLHLRVWPFVSQPSHLSTQERRSSERALHDVFPHRQTGENVFQHNWNSCHSLKLHSTQ